MNDHDLEAPSLWQAWMVRLYTIIWEDDMLRVGRKTESPELFNTLVWLADSAGLPEVDDARTPVTEQLGDVAARALNEALQELEEFSGKEGVPYTWQNYNNLHVLHLTRQKAFSYDRIPVGGGAGIVNANRKNNGASWRMVVEMGAEPNAYGVFPGGQSGNPGSRYYNRSLSDWAAGRYHKLLYLRDAQQADPAIQFTQTLQPR
jgi:penicillin amidase